MNTLRAPLLYVAVAVLAVMCLYGAYTVVNPAFSDQEIRASIVDTWQAHALFTFFALIGITIVGVLAVALAFSTREQLVRRLAVLAVLLAASSSALVLYSHIALTERTTRLTGQSFGYFYGLF